MIKKNTCKVCKSVDLKLYLKGQRCFTASCAIEKKQKVNSKKPMFFKRPGQEKLYLTQILEKRKVLNRYNIEFSQLKKYFAISQKKKQAIENILESRLDNIVFRAGFAPNIRTARQIITHGFITVDNKKCNIPSVLVKPNVLINVNTDKRIFNLNELPTWLTVNKNTIQLNTEVLVPQENLINFKVLCEFLSRYV